MFVVGDIIQTILDAFFLGHPVVQILSKYYADIVQILPKYCPNIVQILSKYCPNIVQISYYLRSVIKDIDN